jgi:hypothetical protein
VKRVLLLTLQAQLVDMPDDARSRRWSSPLGSHDLPIETIEFPRGLRHAESVDSITRNYLNYTDLESAVNICCNPVIHSVASAPYQRIIKSLANERNHYRWRMGMTYEQERHWRSLSPWQRVWLALRCVPFTRLEPPQSPPRPEYIP